jgi:predicted glycosyltransferase
MREDYLRGRHYDKLRDYTAEPFFELLALADVVVTDYSSVIFDASLLGTPMVFYCPDFDTYERDFYLDYPADLPVPWRTHPTRCCRRYARCLTARRQKKWTPSCKARLALATERRPNALRR